MINQKLIEVVTQRIPKRFAFDPLTDIQVLTPMNRGTLGATTLNVLLQQALNPNPKQKITQYGVTYAVGDKVIQQVNNYDKEVFNGDIGYILSIDTDDHELVIRFENREIIYATSELDELALAYAISIHKSQGSEYPVVVIPLAMQHYMLLERNLLYTAITRGKKLVVLIGEKKAVALAVHRVQSKQRLTKLAERLQKD